MPQYEDVAGGDVVGAKDGHLVVVGVGGRKLPLENVD